ncbi:MAG: hypothetical protein Q9170_005994 [Blastenia crenularia]
MTTDSSQSSDTEYERAGIFNFMGLPLEIRHEVYKYALISNHIQPAVADSFYAQRHQDSAIEHETVIAVNLVRVSKQIYDEAIDVLYSRNCFTTLYRPSNEQIWDVIEVLSGKRDGGSTLSYAWTPLHASVSTAVSSIYDVDCTSLPKWLFGSFAPGFLSTDWKWDPWQRMTYEGYDGFYLVVFLRMVGAHNAARITELELSLDSLPNAAGILPLFAEIIRQHMKGLRKIVIDFDLVNDYGSYMEFDERNEYQAEHAIDLFSGLRTLLRDLPWLNEIEMSSCAEEMQSMADAILEEKLTGVSVDLAGKWSILFEEAKESILAIPEIANEPCTGYRVEPYIYLPNWYRRH